MALDADLISSFGLAALVVTELPWVILHLVLSASSSTCRILMAVMILGRPRENCCPSCSPPQSAAAQLLLNQ